MAVTKPIPEWPSESLQITSAILAGQHSRLPFLNAGPLARLATVHSEWRPCARAMPLCRRTLTADSAPSDRYYEVAGLDSQSTQYGGSEDHSSEDGSECYTESSRHPLDESAT